MPEPATLLLFAAASLALLVVPGPAVLFVVARSLEHGRRAGVVSVLGVHAGSLVHVAAAAVGLSALIASSATAFALVRYAGAAYLLWLGVSRLRRTRDGPAGPLRAAVPAPTARLLRQGFVVNVLNPKTAVFFLAFLPQFVAPERGPAALQAAVLGLCFVALGVLTDGAWALAAGGAGERLRRSPALRRALDRCSAAVYLALGATAAAGGDRPRG